MYEIKKKSVLAENIYLMDIYAPKIAESAKPGQFLIVMVDEYSERIPLTICDYNKEEGTVTIVVQIVGYSTKKMFDLEEGQSFSCVVGPLGNESEFVNSPIDELKKERILLVAGGVGSAPIYPQVKELKNLGIDVDVIIGSRNKDLIILKDKIEKVAKNLYIATDDGSEGYKGLVTDLIKDLVQNKGKSYTQVICIGPMIMMKFVCILTKELNIPTIVSLNPIMVDGTGMCGACRVSIGDKIKFVCVDGPEFDGHLVNFDEAMHRQKMYKTEEGRAMLKAKEGSTHHGGCGNCGGDH